MRDKLKRAASALLSVLFWGAAWHVGATLANRSLILKIPLPLETVKLFLSELGNAEFLSAVGASVMHITAGFLAAVLIGTLMGMLSGRSRLFAALTAPLLHTVRAVPVASFIFVAWLFISSAVLPSVIAALMVIPVVWGHVGAGLRGMDERYAETARVFGMSRVRIWLHVRLPLLLPELRAGCVTGLGIAWKAGVAAEVICNPTGSIGALLQKGKATLEYGEVFAVTLAVVLLSLLMENLLKLIWKEDRHGADRA